MIENWITLEFKIDNTSFIIDIIEGGSSIYITDNHLYSKIVDIHIDFVKMVLNKIDYSDEDGLMAQEILANKDTYIKFMISFDCPIKDQISSYFKLGEKFTKYLPEINKYLNLL